MQNLPNFKDTLIKEARLLSLTKSDCDLFIIAQANTLTYQQLAAAGTVWPEPFPRRSE